MTDKEFKKQRRRVRRMYHKWAPDLGLRHWWINLHFHRGPYEIDGKTNDKVLASVFVRWEYLTATISFNLAKVADIDDDELLDAIIHEAMHVHLREMREEDPDLKHEERVATYLQRTVRWSHEAGKRGRK